MRALLIVAAILVVAELAPREAEAQNYPWCAYYGGVMGGGGTNCGFTTFQQCLATVSGIGGSCEPNTQYVPPPGPRAPAHRRHHRRPAND
jgi:Protein of unknown function (DUF3551)